MYVILVMSTASVEVLTVQIQSGADGCERKWPSMQMESIKDDLMGPTTKPWQKNTAL